MVTPDPGNAEFGAGAKAIGVRQITGDGAPHYTGICPLWELHAQTTLCEVQGKARGTADDHPWPHTSSHFEVTIRTDVHPYDPPRNRGTLKSSSTLVLGIGEKKK